VADDRNQNVKKQLLKKREDAVRRKVPLAPGEMVDDALARGLAGTSRWLKKNFGVIQWVIVGAIVAGAGWAAWDHRSIKRAEAASGELIKGTVAEKGRISGASASKPEDEAPDDPTPVFKSADERRDTALASYRKVTSTYPGSGAAILARLGEAGVLLDKRNWDGALVAYRDVKGSPLAAVDASVRGAALEGIGLALEGKGDVDEALKSFKELEGTNVPGQKELGLYHQARILFAKNDLDKAKELLKSAKEGIKKASGSSSSPGDSHPFSFLDSQVDDLLRRIDPSAVPPPAPPGGPGKSMSPEDLQRLQEQLQRRLKEQKK
jgi:predicted negative regulator of RcsB-dependent stress response